MKHKLIIRPRAEVDRAAHFLYLADRSPAVALNLDKALEAAFKRIRANPQVGARLNLPNLEHLDLRFF